MTVCRSASNLQLAREELGGGGWVEGGGEASEAAPTHDQEVEVLLLEEKRFRNKKKRTRSWPGGAPSTLWYQKCQFGYPNKRSRLHTPPFQHQHQHYICVLLSGFRSLNLRHFYRTRVRSLGMLVTNSLTHWLTDSLTHWLLFSRLDRCDPGVRRCQLKTCWSTDVKKLLL